MLFIYIIIIHISINISVKAQIKFTKGIIICDNYKIAFVFLLLIHFKNISKLLCKKRITILNFINNYENSIDIFINIYLNINR